MSKYNNLFDEKLNDFDKKLGLFLNDTKPKLIYGKVIGYILILSVELYGIIKKKLWHTCFWYYQQFYQIIFFNENFYIFNLFWHSTYLYLS